MTTLSRGCIAAKFRPALPVAFAVLGAVLAHAADAPATASTDPKKASDAEVVQLNAFEVRADTDNSYGALESTSITRFRTDLSKLPITADVFTETFMRDVAATSVEQMVVDFGGAGVQTSDAGAAGAFSTSPGDRVGSTAIVLRGQKMSVHRDGFQPATGTNRGLMSATDNFSVERGEVIHGATSLLYSNSGGGGVINLVSKQARLGRAPFARIDYGVDKYGSQRATFDYGAGSKRVAVRVAGLDTDAKYRRDNLGGKGMGLYAQIAVQLPFQSILRVWGQKARTDAVNSANNGNINNYLSSTDPRRGLNLRYLVATNQISDIANLYNPGLTLNNVDSFRGWWSADHIQDAYTGLSLETKITHWLTTQVAAVYDDNANWQPSGAGSLTPAVGTAPYAVGANPFSTSAIPVNTPGLGRSVQRKRGLRVSALADNRFFNGKLHSQTLFGGETTRERNSGLSYVYALSDSKGNVIIDPTKLATERGMTLLSGPLWFPVGDGLNAAPQLVSDGAAFVGTTTGLSTQPVIFKPSQRMVTFTDPKTGAPIYYTLVARRIADPAAITPTNPFGVVGNNGNYNQSWVESHGYYMANVSDWFDGKVETLSGLRYSDQYSQNTGVTIVNSANTKNYSEKRSENYTYTIGGSYALTRWIRPYADYSTSSNPQLNTQSPIGIPNDSSHGQTTDIGVKLYSPDGRIQSSVTWSRNFLRDDAVGIDTTYVAAINPTGINGQWQPLGLAGNSQVNVDRKSQAWEAKLDMQLTRNWRSSFNFTTTDGTYLDTVSFNQVYNDEFYLKNGNVTYADGTIVTVKNTTTQKSIGVDNTTAGIPLTLAMLNTVGGAYSAQPDNDSGHISNSNLLTLMKTIDPVHGSIGTGRTGLPISAIQYGFTDPNQHHGVVSPIVAGDKTIGYNHYSMSFVNHYDFTRNWLKGIGITHVLKVGYQFRSHYYSNVSGGGNVINAPRVLFLRPTIATMDLGLSYRHKLFGKYSFSTQVNVSNVLNHYQLLFPPTVTGSPLYNNVIYTAEPRSWIWTNSISF